MASLQLCTFAILCLILSAVVGQNVIQEGSLDIETGYVWADVLTDGITNITGGDITADTLTLTGRLIAGDTHLKGLETTDLAVADLWTSSLTASTGRIEGLDVVSPAMFEGDVTISGNLNAGETSLGATRLSELHVQGQADIQGVVFAQQDVEVTTDLNVGGVARLFGDVTAELSLSIEEMLTVRGSGSASNFQVKELTQTLNLQVSDLFSTKNLWVENLNVTGNLNVNGDIASEESLMVGKTVNAKTLTTMSSVGVQGNMTVNGWLFGQSATFTEDVDLTGWERVHGSLSVGQDVTTLSDFMTNSSLIATGDITGEGSVMAVDSDFSNLMVDTSTIETLTSTFVTATTLETQDATATNSFLVTGETTLDTLNVVGQSVFADVEFVSLITQDLIAENTESVSLNSTMGATLTTVEVMTMLTVGSPSQSTEWFASFENIWADNVTVESFQGDHAVITTLSGESLNYQSITGMNATIDDFTSTSATIVRAEIIDANIITLVGETGNFSLIDADSVKTTNISTADADLMNLFSDYVWAEQLHATTSTINSTSVGQMSTNTFQASNWGNLTELYSTTSNINLLNGVNATVTNLVATTALTTSLWGQNLTYNGGTLRTQLTSNHHAGVNAAINGLDTEVLYAYVYANISDSQIMTLKVTESSWINNNASVRDDLAVEGFVSLQEGIIAGDSVIAALTVVGDTLISSVSVTGPAFLTDLDVKRMTITDSFEASTASIANATIQTLSVSSNLLVGGTFQVHGDSRLGGNLVVQGTTQFQTGSFSRIGTALLTTTDMEVFNMNVASGLFGGLTIDDLTVNRGAEFDRSITLLQMLSSTSSGTYSFFSSILPTELNGTQDGTPITIQAATVLHTGQSTVDALVFTSANDSSVATLRITGDGYMDFMGGTLDFEELEIQGGIVFENENNVAWARGDAIPTTNLARGASAPFYSYPDLIDRDLVSPGELYDPTRFSSPSNTQDLITLSGGHYRVSGSVLFAFNSPATANSRIIAEAGVNAYSGTQSGGAVMWTTDCTANFQSIGGATWGGSCAFDDVVVVEMGQTMTLRTFAEWTFSTATLGNTLRVDPRSTILIEELFERASETQF